jgi:hypothetical protein
VQLNQETPQGEVLKLLADTMPDALSPREALELLYRLKARMDDKP